MLTASQTRVADAYIERTKKTPTLIKFVLTDNGEIDLADTSAEATAFWMSLLGLTHGEELTSLLGQIARQAPSADQVEATVNRTLASIAAMAPRDSVETMLCSQMVAIQNMTMRVAGQSPSTFEASGSQANALTKLAKTFAAQLEALTRYRARGQQNIKVEHIHVHDGGQVAVGNFGGPGGGVASNQEDQPHVRAETAELPERQAVLSHVETIGLAVSRAGSEGLERMPVPRGEGRRADGQ